MWHRAKRHIMWFPFLIVSMTIILAITIVVVNRDQTQQYAAVADVLNNQEPAEPAVTDEAYEAQVQNVLRPVWTAVETGEGDVEALTGVRDALVEMRVSSAARAVHIQLVAAVNQLLRGVQGDADALADAQLRFTSLTTTYTWLR